jgi:hypothetical protein
LPLSRWDPIIDEASSLEWAYLGQVVVHPILEAVTFSLTDGPTPADGVMLATPVHDDERLIDSNMTGAPASLRLMPAGPDATPAGSNMHGAPATLHYTPAGPTVGAVESEDGTFINTSRGASPGSMQHNVISKDLAAFKEAVVRPLHETTLTTSPRRWARCVHTMAVSWHSAVHDW